MNHKKRINSEIESVSDYRCKIFWKPFIRDIILQFIIYSNKTYTTRLRIKQVKYVQ